TWTSTSRAKDSRWTRTARAVHARAACSLLKTHAYAACGVGVYLLVDRDDDSVTVHSDPTGDRYRRILTLAYGHTVEFPGIRTTLNNDRTCVGTRGLVRLMRSRRSL